MKFLRKITLFTLLIAPAVGFAQVSYFDNIDLSISPESPRPGETVSIEVDAFLFNPEQSSFTWYVDGSIFKQGIGLKEIQIKAKKANISSIVTVVVNTENGTILEEQITIQPTEVTLLWEANTNTPLFYKGKSLHTPGSSIKLVAIPNLFQNSKKVSTRSLIYTWEVNNKILGSMSGIGKNLITIENPTSLKDMRVEVRVTTQDGLVHGIDKVIIPVEEAEIHLYKEDSLLGREYNLSLKNTFNLTDKEITIFANPFFFSPNTLSYKWKIDNDTLDVSRSKITVRSPEEGGASSNVAISVENDQKFLQSATNSFKISFSETFLESLFNF